MEKWQTFDRTQSSRLDSERFSSSLSESISESQRKGRWRRGNAILLSLPLRLTQRRFKWSFRVCCYRDFRHLSMDEDSVVFAIVLLGWLWVECQSIFLLLFEIVIHKSWAKAEKWNLSNYWMFDFRLSPMSLLVLWGKCWTSPLDFGVQKKESGGETWQVQI